MSRRGDLGTLSQLPNNEQLRARRKSKKHFLSREHEQLHYYADLLREKLSFYKQLISECSVSKEDITSQDETTISPRLMETGILYNQFLQKILKTCSAERNLAELRASEINDTYLQSLTAEGRNARKFENIENKLLKDAENKERIISELRYHQEVVNKALNSIEEEGAELHEAETLELLGLKHKAILEITSELQPLVRKEKQENILLHRKLAELTQQHKEISQELDYPLRELDELELIPPSPAKTPELQTSSPPQDPEPATPQQLELNQLNSLKLEYSVKIQSLEFEMAKAKSVRRQLELEHSTLLSSTRTYKTPELVPAQIKRSNSNPLDYADLQQLFPSPQKKRAQKTQESELSFEYNLDVSNINDSLLNSDCADSLIMEVFDLSPTS